MKHLLLLPLLLASAIMLPQNVRAQVIPAPTEKQLSDLDKVAAPYRKKVVEVLEADKSGQYQAYLADLKALAADNDVESQKSRVDLIVRKYGAFIKNAFVAAQVDLASLRRQYAQVLGHNKFAMDDYGSISSLPSLPKFDLSTTFNQQVQCPFESEEEFSNHGGLAGCESNVGTCVISMGVASEFAGGCRTKGSLGAKFELPATSFQKVTVRSQFNFDYWGFAFGAAGYGQFNAKIGLRLKAPGMDKIEILHDAWCVAPVLFVNVLELNASDFVAQAVFTGNFPAGSLVTAMTYTEAFAFGAGVGAAAGDLSSEGFDFVGVKGN